MTDDELEKEFDVLLKQRFSDIAAQHSVHGTAYLGKTILRLNRTSTRLVTITNVLTVAAVALAAVQAGIAVMLYLQR
jgi:hypothetical protein